MVGVYYLAQVGAWLALPAITRIDPPRVGYRGEVPEVVMRWWHTGAEKKAHEAWFEIERDPATAWVEDGETHMMPAMSDGREKTLAEVDEQVFGPLFRAWAAVQAQPFPEVAYRRSGANAEELQRMRAAWDSAVGYAGPQIRDKITAPPHAGGEVVNMKVRIEVVSRIPRLCREFVGTVVAWSQSVERFGGAEFFQVPCAVLATADGIVVVALKQHGCDVNVTHVDHERAAA